MACAGLDPHPLGHEIFCTNFLSVINDYLPLSFFPMNGIDYVG